MGLPSTPIFAFLSRHVRSPAFPNWRAEGRQGREEKRRPSRLARCVGKWICSSYTLTIDGSKLGYVGTLDITDMTTVEAVRSGTTLRKRWCFGAGCRHVGRRGARTGQDRTELVGITCLSRVLGSFPGVEGLVLWQSAECGGGLPGLEVLVDFCLLEQDLGSHGCQVV